MATYNIWDGGEGRLDEIAHVLRGIDADAVAVIEATSRENAQWLAHRLGMELVFGEANLGVHLAWLTRLPVRRATNHRPRLLAKTLLEIEVETGRGALRLFATHLASRHDPRPPSEEIAAVLETMSAAGDAPHVLVGDLNALTVGDPVGTPPPGVEKRGEAVEGVPRLAIGPLLEAGYLDCFRALHPEHPGYTYLARAPWLRLDYVFASPAVAPSLRSCETVGSELAARASDHLPVVADFRL
ncbi:MAG: endonuclease/exonuclease/phosphatase family protein [Actinomycetota bacterium]|nr:endonuclease/exonuclease/phosphatase family protein [Actinomycetota bacterium]